MVTVKITETYDLSTQVNKMGLIGIHTPSTATITKVWGNLFKAHSHFRLTHCDVSMACASLLPADPLQIGTSEGDIAPQDMFNPILYSAMSNEGFNRLINRLYHDPQVAPEGSGGYSCLVREDIDTTELGVTGATPFDLYYGLLADSKNWRKAMPQSGLQIRGLYPIVYSVVSTYGNGMLRGTSTVNQTPEKCIGVDASDLVKIPTGGGTDTNVSMYGDGYAQGFLMKGPSMRLPSIPTTAYYASNASTGGSVYDPSYPPCYVCAIVLPPGKLNKFYFRMRITWYVEFTGLRSDIDAGLMSGLTNLGKFTYMTDYAEQSKTMDNLEDSIDTHDADLEHVMTSA